MSDKKRFHLMNIALALVITVVLWFDRRTAVQLMALTGTTWLAMLLIVPRLFYSGRYARWHNDLERIAKISKYTGLWVAGWFVAHAATATLTYYGLPKDILAYLQDFQLTQPIVLASLSLGILLLLVLLSNKWSYAHIAWWKHINMLVWVIPCMGVAHSLMAAQTYLGEGPLLFIAPLLLGLSAVIGYDALLAKQKRFTDKLRLVYLSTGAFIALVVVFAWPR